MAEHATPRRAQDSSAELRRSRHLSRVPAADPSLRRSQWSRLAMLIGDRKRTVALLALCSVVAAMCEAGILAVAARAATSLVGRAHQAQGKFGPVHLSMSTPDLLYVGLGLAVLRLLLQIPNSYLPARIAGDVQAAMRVRLMRAYSHASWEKQSQDREGHFQEMMSNQIQQASTGALQTTQLIIAFCTFLILVAGAFALNPVGAGVVFVAASLMFAALRPANARAMRLARQLSAAQLEYAGAVGEANRMTEETNVFGVAGPQSKRVDAYVMVARGLFVRVQVLARGVPNLYQSLIYIILVAGLLVISLSGLSHFSELERSCCCWYAPAAMASRCRRSGCPYASRCRSSSAWRTPSTATPRARRCAATSGWRQIESLAFEKVTYYYQPDRPVLRDVSFAVERGETIGVVGPSGAGKSTIVQILLSLRDPRSGRYAINGIDATQIKLSDLHRRIAYVPQAPKLLHASVAENVRFHRDYDDAAVERACRLAFIHDEIMSWPAGYDTIVGPRADAVSGGQQQRICLARALVSSPSILVLDEPTSALDPRSEGLIQQSLEDLRDQMTLFIIAHRMSTLSICDRVMVVLDGELNAFATLPELSESNDYYRFASGFASASASPG